MDLTFLMACEVVHSSSFSLCMSMGNINMFQLKTSMVPC